MSATPDSNAETAAPRARFAAGWRRMREASARALPPPGPARTAAKVAAWIVGVLLLLALLIVLFLVFFDWNYARGPVSRIASARLHRQVAITGDLRVHPWSLSPSATADGITVANPAWAGKGRMAQVGRLSVRIKLLPLIAGRVVLPLLRIDRPDIVLVRDAQGRATWDFSDGKKAKKPAKLPPIQTFIITDGSLKITDAKRQLEFTGTVAASEERGAEHQGFRLAGQGSLNRTPFFLRVEGGPLINVRTDRPYPFDAAVRAGDTRITAKGAIPKPFDFGRFHADLMLRGSDLSDLYDLTGVSLPNTPPYRIAGRLTRDEMVYKFNGFTGQVGDSDIHGDLAVNQGGERPRLTGEVASKRLDLDDLFAIFGGAPATGRGETVSATQQTLARQAAASDRIFPDATLNVEKIHAIDADVRYRADAIDAPHLPLRSASAHIKLNDGLLVADPVSFNLPQGSLAGRVSLDARKKTPVTSLDVRLSNARIEQLLPIKGKTGPAIEGALVGRAKLTGAGNSVHRAMADADGEVTVVAPGGEIRQAFAELLGVNLTKGLGLLFSKNEQQTPITCAVAHFNARDGVLSADRLVFDTGVVQGRGSGTIDLGAERLDLQISGKPKKFRLVRLNAPITVKGPIRSPKVGVDAGAAIAQGAIGVAAGALLAPLAAILPFVDAGLAKNANCAALLAQAKSEGAPVKDAKP